MDAALCAVSMTILAWAIIDKWRERGRASYVARGFEESLARHQQWLYEALRANHGSIPKPPSVSLAPPAQVSKTSVFSPIEDPMAEFTGELDDWHG